MAPHAADLIELRQRFSGGRHFDHVQMNTRSRGSSIAPRILGTAHRRPDERAPGFVFHPSRPSPTTTSRRPPPPPRNGSPAALAQPHLCSPPRVARSPRARSLGASDRWKQIAAGGSTDSRRGRSEPSRGVSLVSPGCRPGVRRWVLGSNQPGRTPGVPGRAFRQDDRIPPAAAAVPGIPPRRARPSLTSAIAHRVEICRPVPARKKGSSIGSPLLRTVTAIVVTSNPPGPCASLR